jgi:hypothetical protein
MEEGGQPDEVPYGRVVRAAVWHPSDLCLLYVACGRWAAGTSLKTCS